MNYFAFIITRDFTQYSEGFTGEPEEIHHFRGHCGVGKTSSEPGIAEYPDQSNPYGIWYVTPGWWVQTEAEKHNWSPIALSSEQIKKLVLAYWNQHVS
jgi:hypothetical protein